MTTSDLYVYAVIGVILVIIFWIFVALIGAIKEGVLKLFRRKPSESMPGVLRSVVSPNPVELLARSALREVALRDQRESLSASADEAKPVKVSFEVDQLTKYYAAMLSQSKISFWFSLIFASIGFLVIVYAAFPLGRPSSDPSVVQLLAGIVIDAVAALFFVQSKRAQRSMGEFFDKLRSDRSQQEARNLTESISSTLVKDALKMNLALYYSGLITDGKILMDMVRESIVSDLKAPGSVHSKK